MISRSIPTVYSLTRLVSPIAAVALVASTAALAPPASAATAVQWGNLSSSEASEANMPSASSSRTFAREYIPNTCPAKAPRKLIRVPGKVRDLCNAALRDARSPYAKKALRYAFANLGAKYADKGIGRDDPGIFDCSSLIGRAYNSAGAPVTDKVLRMSTDFYPFLNYTGAFSPSVVQNTNVVLIRKQDRRAGDFVIQSNFKDLSKSGGGNGHAQMSIGHGLVIQSTPFGPHGVSVWPEHNGFKHEWWFRVLKAKPQPVTPLLPDTGAVFHSDAARLGARGTISIPALQTALIASGLATPELVLSGVTNTYDPPTEESVKVVKASMGYVAIDGIADRFVVARLGLTWAVG